MDEVQTHSYLMTGSCGLYAEMMLKSDSYLQSGKSFWLVSNPIVFLE